MAFDWTSPTTGAVITISRDAAPESGVFRRIRKMDDLNAMYELLEAVTTQAEVESTDPLPPDEVATLVRAWLEHVAGGIGLGESASSST